jgi:hypothetical protein
VDPRAGRRRRGGPRQFFVEARERLLAFAAHQFELDAPRGEQGTLRQHYEAAATQGSVQAQLELVGDGLDLPVQAEHVWRWYGELAAGRGSNGWGPDPITWADLGAWQRLTGAQPDPVELSWLLRLDQAWLKAFAAASREKGKGA